MVKVRDPWHPATAPSENFNPNHPAPNFTQKDADEFFGPLEDLEFEEFRKEGERIRQERIEDAKRRKAAGGNPRY